MMIAPFVIIFGVLSIVAVLGLIGIDLPSTTTTTTTTTQPEEPVAAPVPPKDEFQVGEVSENEEAANNITITSRDQLVVDERTGGIAGVMKEPTVVNIMPSENSTNATK